MRLRDLDIKGWESGYSELHVVSDLHLAGSRSPQIFDGAVALAELIRRIGSDAGSGLTSPGAKNGKRIAFVINGDFVDFLAAENATYFDGLSAPDKLADVASHFHDLWEALRSFVTKPNRELVIVLGNHDLELALSHMRRRLVESIAGNDQAAKGRIRLVLDGEPFAASVGSARVVCIHGNDVDPFNVVDYERLRKQDRNRNSGIDEQPWIPNAGTQLVIDVMNGIKRQYPFVDLLKPEIEAVVPILVALQQASGKRLASAAAVGGRVAKDWLRRRVGLLSGEDTELASLVGRASGASGAEALVAQQLPLCMKRYNACSSARELLALTEERFERGDDPLDLVRVERDSTLGYMGALLKLVSGSDPVEVLREALERVQKDQSFHPLALDDVYRDIDAGVPDDVHFVIAGHTHMERSLRRRNGVGRYINTGTWARLMRLRPDELASPELFGQVFERLKGRSIDALQADGLVFHRPAVASIWLDDEPKCVLHRVEQQGNHVALERVEA